MLTARRGRAVNRAHPTRRRKHRRTRKGGSRLHRAKRYTLKGGGNSNNNGNSKSAGSKHSKAAAAAAAENEAEEEEAEEEEEYEEEEEEEEEEDENTPLFPQCEQKVFDEMDKDVEEHDIYFKDYYKSFFDEKDAELDKEISENKKKTEKLQKELEEIETKLESETDEKERKTLEEKKESKEWDISVYQGYIEEHEEFKERYSMAELMRVLKGQGVGPIKGGNARLDSLREYAENDRLPKLKKNIRVWRTLKSIKDDSDHDMTGEHIIHTNRKNGVASTAYTFDHSIIFGQYNVSPYEAVCLEFVIPKGTYALPVNEEVFTQDFIDTYGKKNIKSLPGYLVSNDESEIIILDDFKLRLTRGKCSYKVKGSYMREDSYIDIYECTFTNIRDFSG